MSHQCYECSKWEACPGAPEWFPPAVIEAFCPNQVRWLLSNAELLQSGRWPRELTETGYQGMPRQRLYRNAYFETPIQMIAEVTWRLDRCGKDGELAYAHLAKHYDLVTLASLIGTNVGRLEGRIERAIRYCTGKRRRKVTYRDFVRHRNPAKRKNAGFNYDT